MSDTVLSLEVICDRVRPILQSFGITEAKVFGSYAKGCQTKYSDVDIYVNSGLRGLAFFGLVEEISNALPIPVDLVDRQTIYADGPMHTEIMSTGVDIL